MKPCRRSAFLSVPCTYLKTLESQRLAKASKVTHKAHKFTESLMTELSTYYGAWAVHQCALCIFTKSGPLSNQANSRCIAHAGYFDTLQDNKHLREKTTNLREKTTAFSLK